MGLDPAVAEINWQEPAAAEQMLDPLPSEISTEPSTVSTHPFSTE